MNRCLLRSVAVLSGLWPGVTAAQTTTLTVSTFGFGNLTFGDILANILSVAQAAVVIVATTIFIVGGLIYIASVGNEDKKSRGKDMMFGSLIGLGIILGAKGIMNMTYFFVYGA